MKKSRPGPAPAFGKADARVARRDAGQAWVLFWIGEDCIARMPKGFGVGYSLSDCGQVFVLAES